MLGHRHIGGGKRGLPSAVLIRCNHAKFGCLKNYIEFVFVFNIVVRRKKSIYDIFHYDPLDYFLVLGCYET